MVTVDSISHKISWLFKNGQKKCPKKKKLKYFSVFEPSTQLFMCREEFWSFL